MSRDIPDYSSEYDLAELADLIGKYTTTKGKALLEQVQIKGKGFGFYYSHINKTFAKVHRRSEMYLLPFKKDEKDRLFIFVPISYFKVEIILVPEEDVQFLGFN